MISIREATKEDNAELIALTKMTPMDGFISLRIDREPDFFNLLHLRGESLVLIAMADDRLVGCISMSCRQVYIDGELQNIAYIGDLRVHPAFTGSRVAYKLIIALKDAALSQKVNLYFCVVAGGNDRSLGLFQGKLGIPRFDFIGKFFVYEVLPIPFPKNSKSIYEIREATMNETSEICCLCNRFNRNYQFAPRLIEQDIISLIAPPENSSFCKTLIACKEGKIVATCCAYDTFDSKQNVIINLPILLEIIIGTLRFSARFLPLVTLPKTGEAIRMLYLRNIACEPGHIVALRILLNRLRYTAFQHKYSFITIGFHESDPIKRLVRGLPKFTFISNGWITSIRNDREMLNKATSGIPLEDFALV